VTTIKDVARRAGVSVATVSHVLNETRYVRDDTKDRVVRAVAELGYASNPVAQSLRTGRSKTFGLVMSAVMNPYFNDVVTSIEKAIVASGYSLLLADHRDEHELEYRSVMNLCGRKVDGLLLQPSGEPARSLAFIRSKNVPTVLVDRFAPEQGPGPFDFVGTENFEATVAVVRHLIDHGHRRIGMVAGQAGSSTTTERVNGYRWALESARLAYDPELVVPGESDEPHAEKATSSLLDHPDPPTAIFSANNRMTIGVMRALRARGVVPPVGMALAVFDDFPWADLFTPRLTCASQQTDQIGGKSVALLLRRLSDYDSPPEHVRFPSRFVRRNSCGCH